MRTSSTFLKKSSVCTLSLSLIAMASSALAQQGDELEEIVVQGTRQTIQSAIEIKRSETTIADGLSADDIGDLPALSIGEALETVTGVTSHRENGGCNRNFDSQPWAFPESYNV